MKTFPIGVILDSFRCDLFEAMDRAVAIGAQGFQVFATAGKLSPEGITEEYKQKFIRGIKDRGLTVSALCGDLGHGFTDPQANPQLIDRSKRILDLAKELGTNIVTTHIGTVPEDKTCDTYKVLQEACRDLAEYADAIGSHFAIETGPETAVCLKEFLDTLDSTGVAVNLDPANLIMCMQDDPVQAVYTLRKYIVHTHAKDGINMRNIPAWVDKEAALQAAGKARYLELPLGKGGVDWPNYLKALEEIGYKGFLTIEREVGDDPSADIHSAADFLRGLMK